MEKKQVSELIKAGVHFGHLTRKWNPNMSPYIYMERNGIHIINLYKTVAKLDEASNALKKIAASGRKILFVATKKQAKDIVSESSKKINMPYITERWPGGMLTNFVTIRKAVKKMSSIDRMKQDGTFNSLSKREKLQIGRSREKLEKNLGSISNMTRLPGAIFIGNLVAPHILGWGFLTKPSCLAHFCRQSRLSRVATTTAPTTAPTLADSDWGFSRPPPAIRGVLGRGSS